MQSIRGYTGLRYIKGMYRAIPPKRGIQGFAT
jgi:hypothetical protein